MRNGGGEEVLGEVRSELSTQSCKYEGAPFSKAYFKSQREGMSVEKS